MGSGGVAAGAGVAGATGDAAGVVAEGAVADSMVVFAVVAGAEGVAGAEEATLAWPNILEIRLVSIPILQTVRLCDRKWML